MNIYDISKKAGVSIATVSRVLNGNTNVSEKTRQKILTIMEETGYTPNAFARGLGLNTMNTIGILCADSSDTFLASAIYYLERELRSYGYDSILCCTGYELEIKEKYLNLLLSKRVDAIILVGSNFVEAAESKNQYILDAAKEVPVIVLNGFLDAPNVYCCLCDDLEAIYKVTTKILEQKGPDILYLYRSLSYSGRQKISGFKKAFQDKNLPLDESQILCMNGEINEVKQVLLDLKSKGHSFHAIVTSDDELAIGALKYAKALNLKIPDDISIIGYNNSKLCNCCDPELSTIDNKLEFSCINAIGILMKVLNGVQVPSKTMISADFISRGTTDIK